ncbi:MAG: GAF domain-containing protein [Polyangia bacterium]
MGQQDPASTLPLDAKPPAAPLEVEALRREFERLQVLASQDRNLLEAILHHSPHGILVSDAQGRLTLHNRAAERIWAGSASCEDITDWTRYRAFHPDGRPFGPGDWSMARCLLNGEVVPAEEVLIQRFDGTRGVLLGSCAPIRGPGGEIAGALSVFADITEMKQMAAAEREARERVMRLQSIMAALCEAALPVDVARIVATEMSAILGADQGVVLVPSEDSATLRLLSHSGLSPDSVTRFTRFSVETELPLATVYRTGEPVFFGSWEERSAKFPNRYTPEPDRSEAIACVPIIVNGARIGAISFGFLRPREFSAEDQALIESMARYAGLALERARLYEAEQRARREADRAKHEAELLFDLAAATTRATRLSELYELCLDSVHGLLAAERASILLFDDSGVMRFRAWRGLSDEYREAVDGHSPWERGAAQVEPILIADALVDDSVAAFRPTLIAEGIRALGFIPLIHRRQLFGKFMIYYGEPRAFTEHDRQLAMTIASNIAQAIERARLFEAERAARERTAFLFEASTALSSTLDFRATLQAVARLAVTKMADYCFIDLALPASAETELLVVAHAEPEKADLARELRRRYPPQPGEPRGVFHVIRTGESVLTSLIPEEELGAAARDPGHRDLLRRLGMRSSMIVQMEARGKTFGAITLATAGTLRHYTQADLELAELLGRRAGVAIDNALLYEGEALARADAERSADRVARLQVLTAALSDAVTPVQVATAVIEQGCAALAGYVAGLWELDEAQSTLELVPSVVAQDRIAEADRRLPLHGSAPMPLSDAVRSREPVWLDSPEQLASRYPELAAQLRPDGRCTLACLPLLVEGRCIGGLALSFRPPRALSRDERTFLLTIARHAAQALHRARLYDQAQAASRAKDEFLAVLGHELRNPLAPIVTALHLLRLKGTADTREHTIIERQVLHLQRLVDDLLDISRITRGKVELKRRMLALSEVTTRAAEMVSPLIEQRQHHLSVQVDSDVLVEADPDRMAQVVSNLLNNAAKYTEAHGRIEVVIGHSGEEAFLRVRDNGMGIVPEVLPHVFDAFVRSPTAVPKDPGGLGLGLALVSNLMRLHGGRVTAESAGVGQGSTFTIYMPARGLREGAQSSMPGSSVPSLPTIYSDTARVLVVDDNRDAADLLGEVMQAHGLEVVVAYDGPQALAAVERFSPEVAVLDISMPVMDGYELGSRLRARFGTGLRLFALTGLGQKHDQLRSQAAGFERHFVKPLDPSSLSDILSASHRAQRSSPGR